MIKQNQAVTKNLLLANGFSSDILIQWEDPLGKNKRVDSHNDYLEFLPSKNQNEGLLWINHEYMDPLFIHGSPKAKSHKQVDQEQKEVGASIVYIKKDQGRNKWNYVKNHKLNRRFDAKTKIPFFANSRIENSKFAIGTLGNCSGGITPWKTILTCEEGNISFYGEIIKEYPSGIRKRITNSYYGWDHYYLFPAAAISSVS